MKKSAVLFYLAALLLSAGCGKYEEGPEFSLRTKKARFTAVWLVDRVIINGTGQDATQFFLDEKYTFKPSKNAELHGPGYFYRGTWRFNKERTEAEVMWEVGGYIPFIQSERWVILKLTHNEMIVEKPVYYVDEYGYYNSARAVFTFVNVEK